MFTYNTKGTCSRQIIFDVDGENKIHNVKFIGGCGGNLQGIARLVEGKNIDEISSTLQGIKCRNNTSCPDQLSQAIRAYKEREQNRERGKGRAQSIKARPFLQSPPPLLLAHNIAARHFCRAAFPADFTDCGDGDSAKIIRLTSGYTHS